VAKLDKGPSGSNADIGKQRKRQQRGKQNESKKETGRMTVDRPCRVCPAKCKGRFNFPQFLSKRKAKRRESAWDIGS
jgi:hypothetical protein